MRKPIVVVGAGVLGSSTAYHLCRRGIGPVRILDRNQPASCSTSLSAGLLLRSGSDQKLRLVQKTLEDIVSLEAQQFGVGYQRTGTLRVGVSDTNKAKLQADADSCVAAGIEIACTPADTVRLLVPWLRLPDDALAVHVPGDGVVDPVVLAGAYLAAAKALGAECAWGVAHEVVGLEPAAAGRVPAVRTAGGKRVEGACVVDAGVWAGLLAHRSPGDGSFGGLNMAPTRSHYWLMDARGPDEEEASAEFPAAHPSVILPDAQAYTRSAGRGALLVGVQESA